MTDSLRFMLNGERREFQVAPQARLSDLLAGLLGLPASRAPCGTGACGACTVLLDGRQALACLLPAARVQNRMVVTAEGLASPFGVLSRVQQAFRRHGAAPCGRCTAGLLTAATQLLAHHASPDAAQRRSALAGVDCPCGLLPRALAALDDADRLGLPVEPPVGAAVGAALPRRDVPGQGAALPPSGPREDDGPAAVAVAGDDAFERRLREAVPGDPLALCLEALRPHWQAARERAHAVTGAGIGLAVVPAGADPSPVRLRLHRDGGRIRLATGCADPLGHRSTALAQLAADACGVPAGAVEVQAGEGPPAGFAGLAMALLDAAAGLDGGAEVETVSAGPVGLSAAVHMVELAIGEDGRVAVARATAVHDAGRVVNPLLARSAVEAGVVRGLGRVLCPAGSALRTPDLPGIEVVFLPADGAMRGVGGGPARAAAAAALAAVRDAAAAAPARAPLLPAWLRRRFDGEREGGGADGGLG